MTELQGSEEFKESFSKTKEEEKEENKLNNITRLNEILEGKKEISSSVYGTIIMVQPSFGVQMEADRVYIRSKTNHLLKRDLLTRKQMELIYGQPFKVNCQKCNEELTIGTGEWDEDKENEVKKLEDECSDLSDKYNAIREQYHTIKDRIVSENLAGATLNNLKAEEDRLTQRASDLFGELLKKRAKVIELLYQRYYLFSGSLEEVSDIDRSRYLALHCIKKKDNSPLWNSEKEMLDGSPEDGRIFGVFHFWIRGIDVDFFEQLPDFTR